METRSVHYEPMPFYANGELTPPGVYFNGHPDNDAQRVTDEIYATRERDEQRLQELIDTAPNQNEIYGSELSQVSAWLAKEGLGNPNVIVLGAEEYDQAKNIVNETDESVNGFVSMGRVIAREPDPSLSEAAKKAYVVGLALHEATHASAKDRGTIIVSQNVDVTTEEQRQAGEKSYARGINRVDLPGNFSKYKKEKDGSITSQGNFFEEGFADLARVRGSQELGYGTAPGISFRIGSGDVYYDDQTTDRVPKASKNAVALPARFANEVELHDNGTVTAGFSVANPAAYGLELLDKQLPGLFDQMKAARADPSTYAEVVQSINSIKPGLYKELRELQYNPEDFKKGLKLVQEAIRGPEIPRRQKIALAIKRVLRFGKIAEVASTQ